MREWWGKTLAAVVTPMNSEGNIYESRSRGYYQFLAEVLGRVELFFDCRVAILTLPQELLRRYKIEEQELDEVIDYPRSLKTVSLAIVLKEAADSVKVSLRSKGKHNVAAIARDFGGGGHYNAAGATVAAPMADVRKQLLERLEQEIDLEH